MTSLPRKRQLPNMTAPTREKSRTLDVIDITDRYAFVEGTTDTYEVSFRGLTCTCEAGRKGLHCSHAAAAVEERARLRGYTHVMLGRTQDHAEAFAAMQRAKGKRALVMIEFGWFIVQYGPQPVAPVSRPTRSHAAIQADADRMFE